MGSNLETVRGFVAAWEARDLEAICAAFTEDAAYYNVGMSEVVGRTAIRDFLTPFVAGAERIRWTVHHEAEGADGTVLNERTDVFELAGGKSISIGVMGVFELRDGRIAAWRDYFDVATFRAQMA